MSADNVTSGWPPLLRPDGEWDRVALAAWFQDPAEWQSLMPDDDLSFLGLRSGDLLVTDATLDPVPGAIILMVDEMLIASFVAEAEMHGGRLCIDIEGRMVPLEGEDAPLGLVLVVVGFVPLQGGRQPELRDLLRVQKLPEFGDPPAPPALQAGPDDLPY